MILVCEGGYACSIKEYNFQREEPVLCVLYLDGVQQHGLINYIDTKAKCRHLKQLTCKGTLRQVFIRVHRPEI